MLRVDQVNDGARPIVGYEALYGLLSWDRSVSRALVHRSSVHEVLLTDARTLGDGRVAVGVQFPRWHAVSAGGAQEVVADTLAIEAVRQIGLMLSHTEMGVPLDAVFLAHELGFRRSSTPVSVADAVIDAVAVATVERQGRGRQAAFVLRVELVVGDEVVGTGLGRMTCVSPVVYRRLRGTPRMASSALAPVSRPSAVLPPMVARQLERQVVVTVAPRDARSTGDDDRRSAAFASPHAVETFLLVDPSNPFYFDHPYDHAPGTLLLEAMQQTAVLATGRPTAGARAEFARYVELGDDVVLSAPRVVGERADRSPVTITQGGAVVANGVVYLD
ncbi:AfsA-related hotdog domain-containing protein [uncultured Jatrophihabitans sp.]|uniref:AfsA-related hotdog domain-containing protein n=1 Tax=uncultured Jatrophihabitans sp. TaxID=1610747 RepID=UPI0035CA7733